MKRQPLFVLLLLALVITAGKSNTALSNEQVLEIHDKLEKALENSNCGNSSSNDSILSSREQCDGVSECVSVETESMKIPGDGLHVLHFDCPNDAPYIHNIDVDQNDNVNVVVMGWTESGVTVKFFNPDPEHIGFYQTFLGCSSEPFMEEGERFGGRSTKPGSLPDAASEIPTEANWKTPDACDDTIPDCKSVLTKRHKIGKLKTQKKDVYCPDKTWYVRHKDRVSSHWVRVTPDYFTKLPWNSKGMSFFITNFSASHDHHWQISIACSSSCEYAPGGCPCGKHKIGCNNDPGCKTTTPRTSRCTPNHQSCWSVWGETCSDGIKWECNTTLGWPCCQSC